MLVKAEGPGGRAKIHSDEPRHALGVAQYLRTIGYTAWIEDSNGNLDSHVVAVAEKKFFHILDCVGWVSHARSRSRPNTGDLSAVDDRVNQIWLNRSSPRTT